MSFGEDANTVTINMFKVSAVAEKLSLKHCLGLLTMPLVPRLICVFATVQCSVIWVEPLVLEGLHMGAGLLLCWLKPESCSFVL